MTSQQLQHLRLVWLSVSSDKVELQMQKKRSLAHAAHVQVSCEDTVPAHAEELTCAVLCLIPTQNTPHSHSQVSLLWKHGSLYIQRADPFHF